MHVFISYRRGASTDIVGRIRDRLSRIYGVDGVFRDFESIPPGVSFPSRIEKALSHARVVLAIIGSDWAANDWHAPKDWLRLELETALRGKHTIIPVLVGEAQLPSPETLPASLRPLLMLQTMRIRSDSDFEPDIERLVNAINAQGARWRRHRAVTLGVALWVASMGGAGLAGALLSSGGQTAKPEATPVATPSSSTSAPAPGQAGFAGPDARLTAPSPDAGIDSGGIQTSSSVAAPGKATRTPKPRSRIGRTVEPAVSTVVTSDSATRAAVPSEARPEEAGARVTDPLPHASTGSDAARAAFPVAAAREAAKPTESPSRPTPLAMAFEVRILSFCWRDFAQAYAPQPDTPVHVELFSGPRGGVQNVRFHNLLEARYQQFRYCVVVRGTEARFSEPWSAPTEHIRTVLRF